MFTLFPILIVVISTVGIFLLKSLTSRLKFTVHPNAQIDSTLKFQAAQLAMTSAALFFVYLLNPENFKSFFRFGNLTAPASGINWLGIPQGMAWWIVAVTMGFWITVATGIFMGLQLKQANASFKALIVFLPWVVLFSAMNAFAEESIFRIGIVAPLYGQLSTSVILLISQRASTNGFAKHPSQPKADRTFSG